MKKIFLACWVMLTATLLLPSCLGSDDDATYYDDVAITSFSLGTLNRYLTTTSSAGDDSIYKVSYAGSTYKVAIDQLGGRIFNCDSLPIKTDLKHVVCTLATRNSALVTLKSMISDSLFTFSSTDSLDFSEPRTFRVFSTDGEHHRDYVVSLSVRQYEAGTLLWTAMEDGQMPEIDIEIDSIDEQQLDADASFLPRMSLAYVSWTAANNVKYAMWAGLRTETDTAMTIWRKMSDADHTGKWVYMTQAEDNPYYLPAMAQVALVYYNRQLLALGSNGVIYQSCDQGITWQTNSNLAFPDGFGGAPLKAVVADGGIWLSDANGRVWRGILNK